MNTKENRSRMEDYAIVCDISAGHRQRQVLE